MGQSAQTTRRSELCLIAIAWTPIIAITYGEFTINTMHVNELKKQRLVGIDIYETEDRNRKPFQTLLM
jgi:hypothetical protein